jgi:hypothetical protein
MSARWSSTPRPTDRPTVSRNVTLILAKKIKNCSEFRGSRVIEQDMVRKCHSDFKY